MVRPNYLTPETDVTNLTQTKTPNHSPPNPNDACLMTTIRHDDDNNKSAQRQKLQLNEGKRAETARGAKRRKRANDGERNSEREPMTAKRI
jgi:hypothetical protein